jgi:hypothetical protein
VQCGLAMFDAANSTVFILGAGASWHYGYPTGEALVKEVIEKAEIAAKWFQHSLDDKLFQNPEFFDVAYPDDDLVTRWKKAATEFVALKAGLEQVNPLVIDYYLGWNPQFQDIGRILIAWVILECEHKYNSGKRNINRDETADSLRAKDDWVRFIIHQIAIHCRESSDLHQNKVSFVTFNYDVSLETALRNGLSHIRLFSESDVTKFLGGSRVTHIYGKIRNAPRTPRRVNWGVHQQQFSQSRMIEYHTAMKTLFDVVYPASKGLRVIDPHDKGADDTEIMIARRAIADAHRVFILGYGFDEHNSARLILRETLRHATELANKRISFTNYQDINQINKRASKLFYGAPQYFPPGGPAIQDRYEKSTRNTYDALAMDFDLAD